MFWKQGEPPPPGKTSTSNSQPATTSVLYPGRPFEVRDHDQPTKYVFNGRTRVARVVGSLSPNLRVQKVRLHAGWNLCSLAVSLINALPRFSAVLGYQPLVVQWDPSAGTWLTVAYGEPLRSGTVLWLNAETNGMLLCSAATSNPLTA